MRHIEREWIEPNRPTPNRPTRSAVRSAEPDLAGEPVAPALGVGRRRGPRGVRRIWRSWALPILAAVGSAACASPTPYVQADDPGETGYRTTRITDDVVRVSFRGNASTDRETVETYLLYRAAQVAMDTNHPWIEIRSADVETDLDLRGYNTWRSAPGFYGYPFGRNFVAYPYYTTFGRDFYETRTRVDVDKSYSAMAYVQLHEERPADDHQNVFDAAQVVGNLSSKIELPR